MQPMVQMGEALLDLLAVFFLDPNQFSNKVGIINSH